MMMPATTDDCACLPNETACSYVASASPQALSAGHRGHSIRKGQPRTLLQAPTPSPITILGSNPITVFDSIPVTAFGKRTRKLMLQETRVDVLGQRRPLRLERAEERPGGTPAVRLAERIQDGDDDPVRPRLLVALHRCPHLERPVGPADAVERAHERGTDRRSTQHACMRRGAQHASGVRKGARRERMRRGPYLCGSGRRESR